MSFGNLKAFSGVQEALVLALILVSFLAAFSIPNLDLTFRISIVVFTVVIVFLAMLASVILYQQKENAKARAA